MRDIPMFTTEAGIASLILKEIPYTGVAYMRLQSASDPVVLMTECRDFCRAAGAQKIYAAGDGIPDRYPLHTKILEMVAYKESLPETEALLFPVQEETLEQWRELYNERMKDVPNAAWMTRKDGLEMLSKGSGYFVHADGVLLGIGMVQGDMLLAVVSLKKGAGRDIVLALSDLICGDTVRLEVASANQPAICLYERLGFLKTAERSAWYEIF